LLRLPRYQSGSSDGNTAEDKFTNEVRYAVSSSGLVAPLGKRANCQISSELGGHIPKKLYKHDNAFAAARFQQRD
jgi:hypothetical protein